MSTRNTSGMPATPPRDSAGVSGFASLVIAASSTISDQRNVTGD